MTRTRFGKIKPAQPVLIKLIVHIPGIFAEGTLTVLVALSELSPVVVHFALSEVVAFQVIEFPGW